MFSHLKRMVSKYRHALKQANQDCCMAILENGPDGPACSTSGHIYSHEEFFETAEKIWIQQHARKLVSSSADGSFQHVHRGETACQASTLN